MPRVTLIRTIGVISVRPKVEDLAGDRSRSSNSTKLQPRPNRRTSEAHRLPLDRSGTLFRCLGRSSGGRRSNDEKPRPFLFSYQQGNSIRIGWQTQTRKPQSRRVPENLISFMRIPECECAIVFSAPGHRKKQRFSAPRGVCRIRSRYCRTRSSDGRRQVRFDFQSLSTTPRGQLHRFGHF